MLPQTEGISSTSKEQTEDSMSYNAHSFFFSFLICIAPVIKINNAIKNQG